MLSSYLKKISAAMLILVAGVVGSTYAHPGHGETSGHSFLHYLTEPFHALPLLAVIAITLSVIVYFVLARKRKQVFTPRS